MNRNVNGFVPVLAAGLVTIIDELLAKRKAEVSAKREKLIEEAMAVERRVYLWKLIPALPLRTYRFNREQAIVHLQVQHEFAWWSPWDEVSARYTHWTERLLEVRRAAQMAAPGKRIFISSEVAAFLRRRIFEEGTTG